MPFFRPAPRVALIALALMTAATACDEDPVVPELPAAPATIDIEPGSVALSAIGSTAQLEASVRDEDGEPMPDASVVWYSSDATVAVVDPAGVVTARGPGQTTVGAVAGNALRHVTVTVTQTATSLAFLAQPADTRAGEALPSAVQVEVRDAAGQRVRGANDAITLSLAGAPDDVALGGTVTANAQDGIATFAAVYVERAGTDYTLDASAAGLTGAGSAAFSVEPGDAAKLVLAVSDDTITAGIDVSFEAAVTDAWGNPVSVDVPVRLDIAEGPVDGELDGSLDGTTAGGTASFPGVVAEIAGTYEVRVRSDGLEPGSARFDVHHAAPHEIEVPSLLSIELGQTTPVVLRVRDRYGNLAVDATDTLALSLFGGGSMEGDSLVQPDSGIAVARITIRDFGHHALIVESDGMEGVTTVQAGFSATWLYGGPDHTCVKTRMDLFYCWGDNTNGELGSEGDGLLPQRVPHDGDYIELALGKDHTCGLRTGYLDCWGLNDDYQLTDGDGDPVTSLANSIEHIAAGSAHNCAVGDAILYCWGANDWGQVGVYSAAPVPSMVPVGYGLAYWGPVSPGGQHTCSIDLVDRDLWCWGSNAYGQLGYDWLQSFDASPANIDAGEWQSVSAGGDHTCAITQARELYCWGRNDDGQLGDGTTVARFDMEQVAPGIAFNSVAAGVRHTCALEASGQALCWGANEHGQLGDGSVTSRPTPMRVVTDRTFVTLVAGEAHTCGLTSDSRVYCWGAGYAVGSGVSVAALTPRRVAP